MSQQGVASYADASHADAEHACSICLCGDYDRPVVLACTHTFCTPCLTQWVNVRDNATCPECRAPFVVPKRREKNVDMCCKAILDTMLILTLMILITSGATWFLTGQFNTVEAIIQFRSLPPENNTVISLPLGRPGPRGPPGPPGMMGMMGMTGMMGMMGPPGMTGMAGMMGMPGTCAQQLPNSDDDGLFKCYKHMKPLFDDVEIDSVRGKQTLQYIHAICDLVALSHASRSKTSPSMS
jgi:hypothetical protein